MRRPSGTWTMPLATMPCAGSSFSDSPSRRTSPSVIARMPEMALSVVLLPAPLAPIRVTIWSLPRLSDTPRRAWILP